MVYRIFLTSPGDVRYERALARAVIEQIHTERAFRGRINLECIAWDLHDLYGNVWEWVEDDWRQNYGGAPADGRAWVDDPRGAERVIRGGSWRDDALSCRSANRSSRLPEYAFLVGFRLSRSVTLVP